MVTAAPYGDRDEGTQPRDRPKTTADLRPARAGCGCPSQPHVNTPPRHPNGTRVHSRPSQTGCHLSSHPATAHDLGIKLLDRHGWGRGAAAADTRPINPSADTNGRPSSPQSGGAGAARTASGPPRAVQLPRPPGGRGGGGRISCDRCSGLPASARPAACAGLYSASLPLQPALKMFSGNPDNSCVVAA